MDDKVNAVTTGSNSAVGVKGLDISPIGNVYQKIFQREAGAGRGGNTLISGAIVGAQIDSVTANVAVHVFVGIPS